MKPLPQGLCCSVGECGQELTKAPRDARSALASGGDLLHEIDDAAPKLWFVDARESLRERKPFRRGEEIRNISGRGRVLRRTARPRQVGRPLEEELDRNLQDLRNLLQAAGTDAVGALLIFLDLLERKAEGIAELLLAHVKHHPAHAHTA